MAGQNVSVVVHWLLEVSVRLAKVRHFPTKTHIGILYGFALYSVCKFKYPFGLLLNQESISKLNMDAVIDNTTASTLVCVKIISSRQSPPAMIFSLLITC